MTILPQSLIASNNLEHRSPNGQAYSYQDKDFRVNDKVIHTKNNYDLEVFNGEVGFIREIGYEKDKILRVEYPELYAK